MKRTKNITLLLSLPLLAGVLMNGQFKRVETVEAYDKTKLPTTICLDDYAENDIRDYYSALNNKDESERRGNNLLKNLKPILKNNQQYYSYDDNKEIWKMYEITDRDWNKSPAKDIEGYNQKTNTITGYKYGDSESNPGSNPYLHALYVNREVDNKVHAWVKDNGKTIMAIMVSGTLIENTFGLNHKVLKTLHLILHLAEHVVTQCIYGQVIVT